MTATDAIGWAAACVLLTTIGRQVYTQWRDRSSQGVSHWLFVGQMAASLGFVVYSALLRNWVFVVTNVLMLATAVVGQWLFLRNQAHATREGKRPGRATHARPVPLRSQR